MIHADAVNCALACKRSTTKSETDLVSQLIRQSQDQGSALMCGKHTCKTTCVSRPPKAFKTAAPPPLERIESKRGELLALPAEERSNLHANDTGVHSEATAVEEACPTAGTRVVQHAVAVRVSGDAATAPDSDSRVFPILAENAEAQSKQESRAGSLEGAFRLLELGETQRVHAIEEREAKMWQELLDLDGNYKEDVGLLYMQVEQMDEARSVFIGNSYF